MYKVSNALTSAYGDMDMPKTQGPVSTLINSYYLRESILLSTS